VDVVSGARYRRFTGELFESGSPRIAYDAEARRDFFVSSASELVIVEQISGPKPAA
jgi:hypothetical protein